MAGDWIPVTVTAGRWEADQVISLVLTAAETLPAWEPGAHVDVRLPSGPSGMLAALRSAAETGRPGLDLRVEQFTAGPEQRPAAGGAFEVEFAGSGETVAVPPGTTILEAVREIRPDVLYSCEEGFCGTCETKVLSGEPVHRDTILTEAERTSNETMMICVGGCASSRLVLDL